MTFQDDLNRMLAEACKRVANDVVYDLDRPGVFYMNSSAPADLQPPTITVTKSSGYLLLSVDQLLDAGLITEDEARAQGWTPYIPPPVPWRSRLRWRWSAWRERAGRKIGGWLAGVDLSERVEDY